MKKLGSMLLGIPGALLAFLFRYLKNSGVEDPVFLIKIGDLKLIEQTPINEALLAFFFTVGLVEFLKWTTGEDYPRNPNLPDPDILILKSSFWGSIFAIITAFISLKSIGLPALILLGIGPSISASMNSRSDIFLAFRNPRYAWCGVLGYVGAFTFTLLTIVSLASDWFFFPSIMIVWILGTVLFALCIKAYFGYGPSSHMKTPSA